MKLLKYTLFLLIGGLLLAAHSFAQPGTRRMNISIGIFSPSATIYDYEGAIGVVGSTGYTVDDIEPGDMFWDDLSRYQVDSVEIIVAGSSATVWVTDLYGAGAPQSGKGTLGKPSPNLGLQPMTENGSNFITEAQEAKILTDNLNRMDSLAGDGNGIIDALPVGNVTIDGANNQLTIDDLNRFQLLNSDRITFDAYLFDWDTQSFRWDNVSPYLSRKFVFGSEYTHGLGFPPDEAEGRVAMRMAEGASFQAGDEVTLQFQNIASDPEVFIGHQDGLGFASLPGYNGSESLKTYNKIGGFTISDDGILIRGPGFLPGANVLAYDDNYEGRFDSLSVPHLGYIERNFAPIDASGDNLGTADLTIPSGVGRVLNFDDESSTLSIRQANVSRDAFVFDSDLDGDDDEKTMLKVFGNSASSNLGVGVYSSLPLIEANSPDRFQIGSRSEINLISGLGTGLNFSGYDEAFDGLYAVVMGNDDAEGIKVYDRSASTAGIEYAADYSAGFTARSLVDKAYVDAAGGDGNGVYGGSGSIPAGTTASAPGDGETFYLRSTSGIIDIGNTSGELIRIDNDRDELTVNSDNLELNTTTAIIGDVAGTGNSTKITVDDGGSNIKLGSTGSTWIQTAQGATSITASGVATGKVIVSGASSLPSAISHIEGADTSQVNVRAAGGVAIEATQDIQLNSASVKAANGAFNIYDSVTDGIAHAGASTMKFVTYGSNGYGLVDPIGFSAIHTPTIRSVRMGDVENEYGNMKVVVDIDDSKILIGDDVFGYESTGSIVSLGDHNYNGSGNRIYVDDPNSYVALGNTWGEKPFFFELDNDSPTATPYRIRMGDVNAAYTGVQLVIEDDDEFGNISRVAMGDVTDYLTGTKLTVDLYPEEINLHADNGVIVSGTSHSYTLPVTTPTAADSLYRVMAWKEGVSSFQVMNGANYRTATASGNILPYDDYVEVDPNVTVHLPAPIAALKGKVFHIIAGGGTGGANPGAIDVVDGSSTIEVGSSLTLDTAFESYSLVCNGSVWIILNNKP